MTFYASGRIVCHIITASSEIIGVSCALLCADQVVIANNEDTLQRAFHELHKVIKKYTLILSYLILKDLR